MRLLIQQSAVAVVLLLSMAGCADSIGSEDDAGPQTTLAENPPAPDRSVLRSDNGDGRWPVPEEVTELLGLSLTAFEEEAERLEYIVRVVIEDGESQDGNADQNGRRINVVVADGIVIDAQYLG